MCQKFTMVLLVLLQVVYYANILNFLEKGRYIDNKKIKVNNQLYYLDLDDSNYCLTVT